MSNNSDPAVDKALERFIHGSQVYLAGCYLDIQALVNKDSAIIQEAIAIIDSKSSDGRKILIPLLGHKDEMVRVISAAALYQSQTKRARQTLEQIDQHGITEANMLAWKILLFQGRYNPVRSDPRYEGLFDGRHDPRKFREDTAFRMRALRGQLTDVFARQSDG